MKHDARSPAATQNYIGESFANHTEDKKVERILKLRENCNNLCKEVGIGRSKQGRWTIFARRESHREGFEICEGFLRRTRMHRTLKTKKGRADFRTREESEPKSRERRARTREFGNLGVGGGSEPGAVGVKTKEESEQGRWWRRLAPRDRRL